MKLFFLIYNFKWTYSSGLQGEMHTSLGVQKTIH